MKYVLWFCAFVFCGVAALDGDIFAAAAITLLVFGLLWCLAKFGRFVNKHTKA